MQVFITHNPEDLAAYYGRALPRLEELPGVDRVVRNPLDRDLSETELIDAAEGCDVIVAHRSTPGERAVFEECTQLVAFLRCAVDISTIDVAAASEQGVLIGRADKSFVASTAELALGLMLDVVRNIAESTVDYRQGTEPGQRSGRQVRGQTAGIIGYGSIGSYLADLLAALGMRVVVHDPHVAAFPESVEGVSLDELLRNADVVFPLAPAQADTVDLIDADTIALMKAGSILVNVSRGELVDEEAVAVALDAGHLGGLGMDVGRAADQRPTIDLARRPGVVATPHLGGLTPENADAQALSSVEQIEAMLAGRKPPRSVNFDHADRLRRFWSAR